MRLAGKICRILGAQPPEGFNYELFLDEKGEKISKSQGQRAHHRGVADLCARPRASPVTCIRSPRKAKRLYFDVIPRAVDEYVGHLAAYPNEEQARSSEPGLAHPCRRAAEGRASRQLRAAAQSRLRPRTPRTRRCCGASSAATRLTPRRRTHPLLDQLVGYAIRYFHDFVKPAKRYRAARRARARRAARSRCAAWQAAGRRAVGRDSGGGLRRRQGAWLRAAARLVLGALRGAARPDAGPALRLLRRALRHPGDPRSDPAFAQGALSAVGKSPAHAAGSMTAKK